MKTNKEAEMKVVIPIREYRKLNGDSDFLKALYEAGLDDWEGYGRACRIADGEEDGSEE